MEDNLEKIDLEREINLLKVRNLVLSRFTTFILNNPPEVFYLMNDFEVVNVYCLGSPWYHVEVALNVRYLGMSFFKDLEEYLGHSFVLGCQDGKFVISYTAKYEKI